MNNKLKEAFDRIHAEEELKDSTRSFLARKTHDYKKYHSWGYRWFVPVMASLLLFLAGWGGYRLYFVPVSVISIDINPSLELGVNRFDKVVSVAGFNQDGRKLAASVNVKFAEYTDALEQILSSESVQSCIERNEVVMIDVVGEDKSACGRMLTEIEHCTEEHENTHCGMADIDEVEEAHEQGLSYGKYRAYLELRELDPDISPEDIQGMTMREIRELIRELSGDTSDENIEETYGNGNGWGHHGGQNGHHND